MRRLLLALLLSTPAQAQSTQAPSTELLPALKGAQTQIIAYLPALTSVKIAQALKDAANSGVRVELIAPRRAHLARHTYLLSVALAAAQTPPAPLSYRQAELSAAPLILIDNRVLFLGPGAQDGLGLTERTTGPKLQQARTLIARALKSTPPSEISTLIKARYGLKH